MALRPRIGSVVEIKTRRGLSYAQITHNYREPPVWGWLLRVFRETHASRPKSFEKVVHGEVQFSTFYPVGSAANAGLVEIVSHTPVAPANVPFPIFKCGIENQQTQEVAVWWLWDGTKEWRASQMTEKELAYPLRELVTGDILHRRIEANWTSAGHGAFGAPPIS